MAEQLDPAGGTVQIGPVLVTSPGLVGQVEYHPPGLSGTRAVEQTTPDFVASLTSAGYLEQFSLVITGPRETDTNGGTRAAGGGEDIALRVPGPGPGFAQVMLYTAEDGTLSWHLPEDVDPAAAPATRGSSVHTYRVPRVVSAPDPAQLADSTGSGAHRGIVAVLGKKVFKVLAFPLIEKAGEFVAEKIAFNWEKTNRPHRLRTITPDNLTGPGEDLTASHWAELDGKRALLFVHGTFSSIRGGFGGLPSQTLTALYDRYGTRLLGFDHPTMATSPQENAAWLSRQIPAGVTLTVDLISHSRGGLVVRELCEYAAEHQLEGRLSPRAAVMVGSPNAGTSLADVGYWKAWIDRVTNVLQLVPDNPVTDTLDGVLTVLKHLAVGAVRGLEGLGSMDPEGDYLRKRLNTAHGWPPASGERTRYFAVASNYEPPRDSPLAKVTRDGVTDLVFGANGNDLVVPTQGVFDVAGAGGFPITDRLELSPSDGIEHTRYWTNPACTARLMEWLPG